MSSETPTAKTDLISIKASGKMVVATAKYILSIINEIKLTKEGNFPDISDEYENLEALTKILNNKLKDILSIIRSEQS